MPKASWLRVVLTAALSAVLTGSGQAGLLDASVNFTWLAPDTNTVFVNFGDRTVSGSVEYTSVTAELQIDITDTQLVISNTSTSGSAHFSTSQFNGFKLTINSGPNILSAVADGLSGFNPVDMWIANGNELFLNYSGVVSGPQSSSVIDVTTVPEPSALVLCGFGIIAICLAKRGVQGGRCLGRTDAPQKST